MKRQNFILLILCLISVMTAELHSQSIIRLRPKVIDDVLINPGIGFQTFQRFNKVNFLSWWDDKGVAPIYRKNFLLALNLVNEKSSRVFITDADITTLFPGDNLYDDAIFIPWDMPAGDYQLQIGIVNRQTREPGLNLAIEGRDNEGWYTLGKIGIKETNL